MPPAHSFQLRFRSYRRPLAARFASAKEAWTQRTGFFLALTPQTPAATTSYAEIAPLPSMGSESNEQAAAFLQSLPAVLSPARFADCLHSAPPACAFALATAAAPPTPPADPVPTAALLPQLPDPPRLSPQTVLQPLRRAGFHRFKVKLGKTAFSTEWPRLHSLLKALRPSEALRLDANQAFSVDQCQTCLAQLAPFAHAIEFLEEPLHPAALPPADYAAFAARSPVPLALDESLLPQQGSLQHWIEAAWPGWFICKPSLSGPPQSWLPLLQPHAHRVVLSSALETAIGLSHLLAIATRFPHTVHGFDTSHLFDDPFGLPRLFHLTPIPQDRFPWIYNHCPA